MVSDLLDESLVRLNVEATDWEDAVRKCAQPLVDNNIVTPAYVDDIVKGAKEVGPYFVLTEHVAMPHARPECGALAPGIGIATLKEPVEFGSAGNDPVKFLFTLSAKDSDGHIEAIASLAELLGDLDFFSQLEKCTTAQEVVDLVHVKEGR